ncbi:hypothetical protein GALMADRAFT_221101 [Galerina marginata CBS 339.88]|uniref:Cofilin n=1 Tax=Galerina marginata (strain CBS 339.88) TaxID=685588 RepID=A0A067TT99_GALM3|nr:hypothetical protein GALMADRAFT_221101 [Galerina marginata CBS 339.88]
MSDFNGLPEFEKEGARKQNKIMFLSWSPDDAKIKQKVVFRSSRDALKRALNCIAVEVQAPALERSRMRIFWTKPTAVIENLRRPLIA